MAKLLEHIDDDLAGWLEAQPVFFVGTAPAAADGHVNVSPKGLDTFRVLAGREVVYQDLTGSGAEAIAHLRANGRIVLLFCAFEGRPRIVRLHGRGRVVLPGDEGYADLDERFTDRLGTRAYVRVEVQRVSTSCGYGVPLMDFRGSRDTLDRWAAGKGPEGLRAYQAERNASSIDGLPAYPLPEVGRPAR